jgi:hypothetical protein
MTSALVALTSPGSGASVTSEISNHDAHIDAHMDAFTYRHAELAREALPLSTIADAVRRETFEDSVAGEETS